MFRILLILLISNIGLVSADILSSFPKDRWPVIVKYNVSGCVSDLKANASPKIRIEDKYIFTSFLVFTMGGDKIVNPTVSESSNSLTIHLETARTNASATGCACGELVDVGIQAELGKNKKVYVVVNETVQYELTIPNH